MYSFGANANDTQSRNFFGFNSGEYGKKSSGILKSQKNVIQTKCESSNKMSPYFQEALNKTINEELFERLEGLNNFDFNQILVNESLISSLPDGAIEINEINNQTFSYKLQINDNRLPPYHRGRFILYFIMARQRNYKASRLQSFH